AAPIRNAASILLELRSIAIVCSVLNRQQSPDLSALFQIALPKCKHHQARKWSAMPRDLTTVSVFRSNVLSEGKPRQLPGGVVGYALRVALQVGYSVQPQNRDPEGAISSAISAPQRGH